MRKHGTLTKWNDERGFGFVALPQGDEEIFVHFSAFPRDGVRPRIGEIISFDVHEDSDGKKRAANITRAASRKAMPARRDSSSSSFKNRLSGLLAVLAIAAVSVYGYKVYTSPDNHAQELQASSSAPSVHRPSMSTNQTFKCDGRTHCSQMTSCAEATYFLKHCPNTQMDGNNDGEPCEAQWCN